MGNLCQWSNGYTFSDVRSSKLLVSNSAVALPLSKFAELPVVMAFIV